MEKKNLQNLLIGIGIFSGVFIASQSASAVTCYQILDALGRPVSISKITKKTSYNECVSSNTGKHSTGPICNSHWYNSTSLNAQLLKEGMEKFDPSICTPTSK